MPDTAVLPRGCTNFKLRQLLRRVARLYDLEMARVGLKTTQYSLLSHVVKLGPIGAGALARQLGMEASTLTRNLKPLVNQGLLSLSAGADARRRQVEATALGRERRQEAKRHWKIAQLRLNEQLGVDRVAALHALIDDGLARLADGPDIPGEAD